MPKESVPITLVSYDYSNWELVVAYGSKCYTYQNIPENWYRKLCSWLEYRNYSSAVKFLQRCAKR